MSLTEAMRAVGAWEKLAHPSAPGSDHVIRRAGKLCEEAGEVMGAALKMSEGTRSKQDLKDEVGDLLITALALCYSAGLDPEECFEDRWNNDVRARNVRLRVSP